MARVNLCVCACARQLAQNYCIQSRCRLNLNSAIHSLRHLNGPLACKTNKNN